MEHDRYVVGICCHIIGDDLVAEQRVVPEDEIQVLSMEKQECWHIVKTFLENVLVGLLF